jgi:hypothetical protein
MYTAETVFGEDEVARLETPVQFNGTAHEGHIDERMVILLKSLRTTGSKIRPPHSR